MKIRNKLHLDHIIILLNLLSYAQYLLSHMTTLMSVPLVHHLLANTWCILPKMMSTTVVKKITFKRYEIVVAFVAWNRALVANCAEQLVG